MASIRKRGPYQWEVRIRKKGYPTQSKTFEKKADAQQWARDIESEMTRRVYVSRKEAETTSLGQALDRFERKFADTYAQPKQIRSRIRIIKRSSISSMFLAEIRGTDLTRYIESRKREGRSSQTILHEINLISRLYEVSRKNWGMESLKNPTKNTDKPKQNKGRTRRLEGGEERKLLKAAQDELKPIIILALETAMRRGEIASMRWEYVDIQKKYVHLPKTKNGEARSVPLSPKALDVIKSLPINIAGEVFNIHQDTITKKFGKTVRTAGLKDLRFHDLRHEATSRLFENTRLDIMQIKAITGHKSFQMLDRYTHLRAYELAELLAEQGERNQS